VISQLFFGSLRLVRGVMGSSGFDSARGLGDAIGAGSHSTSGVRGRGIGEGSTLGGS
jgi:hypothetical protein